MKTRKTKEEKFKLIADYKASGLSMTKWCEANGIPTSTLAGWLRGKKVTTEKPKNKARFVEIAFPAELSAKNTAAITVEYKAFKIIIPAGADFKSLEK